MVQDSLLNEMLRGRLNSGGVFGMGGQNPLLMQLRQMMMRDAGAQQRSARLGLMGRSDVDPSTFGFQSLMSDLGGQGRTSDAMSRAQMGLQQQQLQNYWGMLGQRGGQDFQAWQGELDRDLQKWLAQQQQPGFDWGGLASGLGSLAGAAIGGPQGAAIGGTIAGAGASAAGAGRGNRRV